MYKGKGFMSHPYAMTITRPGDPEPGFVIAGHTYMENQQPVGRLLKVRPTDGEVLWDRTFSDRDSTWWNIECYGVDSTLDGGFIVTCGDGTMIGQPWMDCHELTWTAYVYRAGSDGLPLWVANVTD